MEKNLKIQKQKKGGDLPILLCPEETCKWAAAQTKRLVLKMYPVLGSPALALCRCGQEQCSLVTDGAFLHDCGAVP